MPKCFQIHPIQTAPTACLCVKWFFSSVSVLEWTINTRISHFLMDTQLINNRTTNGVRLKLRRNYAHNFGLYHIFWLHWAYSDGGMWNTPNLLEFSRTQQNSWNHWLLMVSKCPPRNEIRLSIVHRRFWSV